MLRRALWSALLWTAWSLAGPNSASAQCMYEIVAEISTPGCGLDEFAPIVAAAISDNGVVVGHFFPNCGFDAKPFMWSEETGFVAIPLPPGVLEAEPRDVNNNGEIVGRMLPADLSGQRAFHYKDGVWTNLPPTGNGIHSEAFGINDDGWVCGYRDTDEGRKAFLWRGEDVLEISSTIRGEGAIAHSVNDEIDSAGIFGSLFSGRGFVREDARITIIPPVEGGNSSEARAINKEALVTGQSLIDVKQGSLPRRSWVFQNGQLTDLGVLPEADHRTIANDINDARQIVGRSEGVENGTAKAFLWQDGEIQDLQTLIVDPPPLLALRHAYAINNVGQIVVLDPGRPLFVLAPVDRPLGDVNIDCVVDGIDLALVLNDWGPCTQRGSCLCDIVTNETLQPPGDGVVDGADLAVVLGNWSGSGSQRSQQRSK